MKGTNREKGIRTQCDENGQEVTKMSGVKGMKWGESKQGSKKPLKGILHKDPMKAVADIDKYNKTVSFGKQITDTGETRKEKFQRGIRQMK